MILYVISRSYQNWGDHVLDPPPGCPELSPADDDEFVVEDSGWSCPDQC